MKKAIYLICLFCIPVYAQLQNDPLNGVYSKSGETSEIFLSYANRYYYNCIIDIDDSIKAYEKPLSRQLKRRNIQADASATGDFDGDLKNDVVNVYDTNNIYDPLSKKGILLTVDFFNSNLTSRKTVKYIYEAPIYPYMRKRICTGNFDNDLEDEFAICFQNYLKDSLEIAIFKLDQDSNIILVDSYLVTGYEWNFDIAAGNLDETIQDEMVLIKNSSPIIYEDKCEATPDGLNCYTVATIKNNLYILKLDTTTNKIIESYSEEISSQHIHDPLYVADMGADPFYFLNGLRIICGDMNGDYKDEIIVGTSFICNKINSYLIFTSFQRFWYEGDGTMHKEDVYKVSEEFNYMAENLDDDWKYIDPRQFITITLKSSEFDNLGGDEIFINDRNKIYIFGEQGLQRKIQSKYELSVESLNTCGYDCFTVADINPDTKEEYYHKEIITLETNTFFEFDWIISAPKDNYGRILGDTYLGIYTFNDSPKLSHKKQRFELDPDFTYIFSGLNSSDYNFERGDILFFGSPDVLTAEIRQPIVILNSPPIHFDVFDGTIYDLNNAYNREGEPPFFAKYYTITNTNETMSTITGTSYGFSDEYKNYNMKAGNGFERTSAYFMEHEKSFFQSHTQNISVSGDLDVWKEDWILSSILKYKYYRYPVYNKQLERVSYFGILCPYTDLSYSWESGNSYSFLGYNFNHENGNILSYKSIANFNDISQDESDFKSKSYATQITISDNTKGNFGFSFADITQTENKFAYQSRIGMDELTKKGYNATVGAEIGINADVFNIGASNYVDINMGTSSYIGSNFTKSSLCTHNTELYKSFNIEGKLGNLETLYNNSARYKVTPYFYHSQCGAMVLDYKVELDPANKSWWNVHYLDSSDLAFILPWRYGTEHGEITLPSQKQKTNEIQFYPSIVAPGDTICIITRVHNYSLKPFIDTLEIDYYLGDPITGVKISDIHGSDRSKELVYLSYDSTNVEYDFEEVVKFFWKVPDIISCSPRIYAVIDPDNKVHEIHKNNNIGWNKLPIYKCSDCNYNEPVGIDKEPVNQISLSVNVFPNPTTGKASIVFTLSCPEHLHIELYSLTGIKLAEITNQYYPEGNHVVYFDGSDLNEGNYFIKTTTDRSTSTNKINIIK